MAPEQAEGHDRDVGPAADVHAMGGIVLVGGRDVFAPGKDAETGLATLPPLWQRQDCVQCVASSPDGLRIVTASRDLSTIESSLSLWDGGTGHQIARFAVPNWTRSVAVSGDGRPFAAGGS